MSAETKPPIEKTSALEWYEDPARLRVKREELGVSVPHLAQRIGRHKSYIEEIESGRIPTMGRERCTCSSTIFR